VRLNESAPGSGYEPSAGCVDRMEILHLWSYSHARDGCVTAMYHFTEAEALRVLTEPECVEDSLHMGLKIMEVQ
jgi:hypothetical protein